MGSLLEDIARDLRHAWRLLRRTRGYRWLDHMIILPLAGIAFRMLRPRDPSNIPKFLRKSAMGLDSLFK